MTVMRILGLLLMLIGCNTEVDGSTDARVEDGSTDARVVVVDGGGPCVSIGDCPSNQFVCAFKIADGCAAVGHCAPVATPTCASIVELCSCDGKKVISGPCYFQSGYAAGPTTGAASCSDAGP